MPSLNLGTDTSQGQSTPSDDRGAGELHALTYARGQSPMERVRAVAVRELAGLALVAGGFLFARRFGGSVPLAAELGVVVLLAGAVWYIVSRIGRRKWMPRHARIQLVLASMLCMGGVLGVLAIASGAREGPGPDTLRYWLSSNQTYGHDSRVALRRGWTIVVGIVWFGTVLTLDRALHRDRRRRDAG